MDSTPCHGGGGNPDAIRKAVRSRVGGMIQGGLRIHLQGRRRDKNHRWILQKRPQGCPGVAFSTTRLLQNFSLLIFSPVIVLKGGDTVMTKKGLQQLRLGFGQIDHDKTIEAMTKVRIDIE